MRLKLFYTTLSLTSIILLLVFLFQTGSVSAGNPCSTLRLNSNCGLTSSHNGLFCGANAPNSFCNLGGSRNVLYKCQCDSSNRNCFVLSSTNCQAGSNNACIVVPGGLNPDHCGYIPPTPTKKPPTSTPTPTKGAPTNTPTPTVTPTVTPTPTPVLYSIDGNVFVDSNNDQKMDGGENPYTKGTSTITLSGPTNKTINTPNGTYNTGAVLDPGSYTVSYTGLPGGYYMTFPLSGPPPQFSVKVGVGQCSVSSPDAKCVNGNITGLNFGISNTKPWIQSFCGNIRVDSGISDPIPQSPVCGSVSGGYAIQTNSTCTSPGVAYSGNQKADFSLGSASSVGWVAGDNFYPEVYKPKVPGVIRTSYQYIETTAKEGGITPQDLSKSCALNNCDISTLSHGVYQANGDLTTVVSNQNLPSGVNIIILVKGNLFINGDVDVPVGSTLLVSVSGDIHVNKNLGEGVVTSTSGTIGGIYSADGSFIIDGSGIGSCSDKRFNIEGSVIVNAGEKGGTFDYSKRDLCAQNANCPVVSFIQRPDLLFYLPAFVKHTPSIFKEVAP